MQICIYHLAKPTWQYNCSWLIEIIVRNKQLTKNLALRESILMERSVYNRKD